MHIKYREYEYILNKCIIISQVFRRSPKLIGLYESYGLRRSRKFYSLSYEHFGYINMCKLILDDFLVKLYN